MTLTKYSDRLKFTVAGDIDRAKDPAVVGTARQQLALLKQAIGFQNLPQGKIRKVYPDGMIISTRHCFGQDLVHVYVPPIGVEPEEIPEIEGIYTEPVMHLLVCTGDAERVLTVEYDEGSPEFAAGQMLYGPKGALGLIRAAGNATLYGSFSDISEGQAVNAGLPRGTVIACVRGHYAAGYHIETIQAPFDRHTLLNTGRVYGPADYTAASNHSCNSGTFLSKTWSKTYERLTLTAFTSYGGPSIETWSVCAMYDGERLRFGSGGYVYGSFTRSVTVGFTVATYFIGFDVWAEAEEDPANPEAPAVETYYVSVCSTGNRRLDVFRLNLDNRTLELVESYSPSAGASVPGDALLGGLGGRTAYWWKSGAAYYWKQEKNDVSEIDPHPEETAGGLIVDSLWNHATDTFQVAWDPYPWSSPMTSGKRYSMTNGGAGNGYTRYLNPYYCSTYEDGRTQCDEDTYGNIFPFTGVSRAKKFVWNELSEFYYWDANQPGNTVLNTYHLVINPLNGTQYWYGNYFIGGGMVPLGTKLEGEPASSAELVIRANGSYWSNSAGYTNWFCFSFNGKNVELTSWMMDPAAPDQGAGKYTQIDIISGEKKQPCTYGNQQVKSFGDASVANLSNPFPHDANWLAVLKSGLDCAERNTDMPAVLYKGFIKLANGDKYHRDEYNAYRGMFLRYNVNSLCDQEDATS